jgi:hypothetical protein
MRRGAWLLVLLGLTGCRRVPPSQLEAPLAVRNVTLAFPADEQGDLFFEVVLPGGVARAASARWELWLGGRRFAEGVVLTPQTVSEASGARLLRIEAPLTWRHLGWRDGATFLDVSVRGEVRPWGAPEGVRLPFRGRAEVLVTGAPVLDTGLTTEP